MIKLEKILKQGLIPKSNNRISNYSNRIHFFKNKNNYKQLLNKLKLNDKINNKNKQYCLLKINTNTNIIYHTDPNYNDGLYTYEYIETNDIEVILKNI